MRLRDSKNKFQWIAGHWTSHGFYRRGFYFLLTIMALLTVAEIWIFLVLEAEAFQRFGSALVAVSIFAVPYYKSLSDSLIEIGHEQQEIGVANHLAHANFASGELMRSTVFLFSVVVAAFGTLQWGYGDLLHCWLHGNGWTKC